MYRDPSEHLAELEKRVEVLEKQLARTNALTRGLLEREDKAITVAELLYERVLDLERRLPRPA